MAKSRTTRTTPVTSPPLTKTKTKTKTSSWNGVLLLSIIITPVALSLLVYQLDEFDSAPLPDHALSRDSVSVPKHYTHLLNASERIGDGLLPGPEDLVYDSESGLIYASCEDGWIKRVKVGELASEATVENWVHVGGRPLGLAFGPDKDLFVAESYKGLMKVTKEGVIKLLTDEAEGVKFKLTDGVDVAQNGVIYFTDASYKYNIKDHMFDILEGRPYGRLLSFDPSTGETQVLVRDLYFANGVAVSPQQDFVVFCETFLRSCRKYYIDGEKKGSVESFVDRLPGFPDNIRYDGEGKFWIALVTENNMIWDSLMRYPVMRKASAIMEKYVGGHPKMESNAGVIVVNLEGEPVTLYSDPGLFMITIGIKVKDYLYYGSIAKLYMSRVNLSQLSASVA